jgi:hypothetical protein
LDGGGARGEKQVGEIDRRESRRERGRAEKGGETEGKDIAEKIARRNRRQETEGNRQKVKHRGEETGGTKQGIEKR